LEPWTIYSIQ